MKEKLIENIYLDRKTWDFVKEAHKDQQYKNGVAYFHHLVRVSNLLAYFLDQNNEGSKEDRKKIVLAGLMHDLLEDTSVKEDKLRKKYNDKIVEMIVGMTNVKGDDNTQDYLIQIENSREEVRLIKLADLFDNMITGSRTIKENGLGWTKDFLIPICFKMSTIVLDSSFKRFKETGNSLKSLVALAKDILDKEVRRWEKI